MIKILMKGFAWKEKTIVSGLFSSEIESYTTHIALQWIDWNPNMNVHFWVLTQISQLAKRLNSGNEIQSLFFAQRNNFQLSSCSFHNKFQRCSSICNSFQSVIPPSVRLTFATVCVPQQCGKVWIMQPSKNVHRAHVQLKRTLNLRQLVARQP